MNWDGLIGIFLGLLIAIIGFAIYTTVKNESICESKGGAYINYTCLKVEVIK